MLSIQPGSVTVATSQSGGHPRDFWVDMLTKKLIEISDGAPEPIRAQAHAFRDEMMPWIKHYMTRAIQSDRTTVMAFLGESGYQALAEALRKVPIR